MGLRRHVTLRRLVSCAGALAVLLVVATTPQLLGEQVAEAIAGLDEADRAWLWWAALAFTAALLSAACAWRAALGLCGGELTRADACARYAVGSLVNTLTPARLGDVVRLALFSRALPGQDRLWTAGGAFAALGAARALALGVLLVVASASGALPAWPLLLVGGAVAAAAVAALWSRGRSPAGHVAHFLDAFRELGRRPAASAPILGWVAVATAARVAGAAASAAALGVDDPVHAALLIVPAIDLAGLFPVTPGNFGLTSGAVAIALQAGGLDLTTALAVGIALHAVETLAGLGFGVTGTIYLAGRTLEGGRLWALRAAGAAAVLAAAALVGASLFVDIV
jgi:uncharacterized membrane protein YbhN (UPF0104 family)